MPSLDDILQLLQGQAQPRPDLITPGQNGVLENARPYTFAGRVGQAGQPISMAQMLMRQPQESPDAEGLGGIATLASGIPLAKRLQLPNNTRTQDLLQTMYRDYLNTAKDIGNHQVLSLDNWITNKIRNVAYSASDNPYSKSTSVPSFRDIGIDLNPNIPRSHQATAILDMVDRAGMMTPERLAPLTSYRLPTGGTANLSINQSKLDKLMQYLEITKPEPK